MNSPGTDEISRILHTSPDVKSFYQSFLTMAASMSQAQVGVAWRGDKAPFKPVCQVHDKSTDVAQLSISQQRHNQLLEQAAGSSTAFIVAPDNGRAETEPLLMFGAVKRDDTTEIVELIIPAGRVDAGERSEIVSRFDQWCSIASRYRDQGGDAAYSSVVVPQTEQESESAGPTERGFRPLTRDEIDRFAHLIHTSLDDREAASLVANEARRVLECDRVSVLIRRGSRFRVAAISGQPSVNRRSAIVSSLRSLATAVLKTGESFWYPGQETEAPLPPPVSRPLDAYLGVSTTRSLAIIPVFDQLEENDDDPAVRRNRPRRRKVIAGIVVEHCNEQWNKALVAPAIETVSRLGSDAIRNSLNHRSLFGYGLWRLLGKSRIVTSARNLPRSLAIVAGLVLLTAALVFIPAPFNLHCDGILLPETRARIFAGQQGMVHDIKVRHGDFVSKGDLLLELENEDIAIEIQEVDAEIDRQRQRLEKNKTLRSTDRENRQSLEGNALSIQAQIDALEKRRQLLESKSSRLKIDSLIDGQVITWDLDSRLKGRPVNPGETLMEVADVEGQWLIELELPDRKSGHLIRALEQNRADGGEGLEVLYQLAADPGKTYSGRVIDFSQASQLTDDQTQAIKVIVAIDAADTEGVRQARSGVSAKICCGTESLGYVWLHDALEFFQSKVFFRLW